MEAARILQRQTFQRFWHTRPLRTSLQTPRSFTLTKSSHLRSRYPDHVCSLHVRFHTNATRTRNTFGRFPRMSRGYATAAETSNSNLTLSQRMKKLSREYGWAFLGVYLGLSALDFPFCFLAVRLLGTDRIGHWEHVIVSKIKEWVTWPFDRETNATIDGAIHEVEQTVQAKVPLEEGKGQSQRILDENETYVVVDHGYNDASVANTGANASIWTQLALAYAIHKSFIFIRVPLTAAVLPKVVKTLRSWGYNIGKMPAKKVSAGSVSPPRTGVNTKGSGVKSE